MNLVRNILQSKKGSLVGIRPEASVLEALQLMARKNIGSVVVLDGRHYLGIFTERDYSRKVILEGRNSSETKVSQIMSTHLPELGPDDSLDKCMELMNHENIRYLPVIEQGEITGIVSVSDVIRQLLIVQQETIHHLENYIHQ